MPIMADGKIQLYGGKVLVDPGAVATADECCCETIIYKLTPCIESGDGCAHCSGGTPKYWTVVISGVSNCDNCDGFAVLNGTYVLTQHATNECEWNYNENGFFGSNKICGQTRASADLKMELQQRDVGPYNHMTLWVKVYVTGSLEAWALVFGHTTDDCEEAWADTSDFCDCDPSALYRPATGDATFTPGDVNESIGATRCPGGDAIYTDTDLLAAVGKAVELSDGNCYAVSVETEGNESDGAVTVVQTCDNCDDCCDDNC